MIISVVSWILFFVCTLSLFVIPESFFGSFDNYCASIIARCITAIVFLFIAFFPAFGKSQIKRYIAFILLTIGTVVGVLAAWTYVETKFGFIKSFTALGVLAFISLVYIVFFEDRKNWRQRAKKLMLMR